MLKAEVYTLYNEALTACYQQASPPHSYQRTVSPSVLSFQVIFNAFRNICIHTNKPKIWLMFYIYHITFSTNSFLFIILRALSMLATIVQIILFNHCVASIPWMHSNLNQSATWAISSPLLFSSFPSFSFPIQIIL